MELQLEIISYTLIFKKIFCESYLHCLSFTRRLHLMLQVHDNKFIIVVSIKCRTVLHGIFLQHFTDIRSQTHWLTDVVIKVGSSACLLSYFAIQEVLLLQTDRATRSVSQNLVNCCTTVGTSCTTNSEQIEVLELKQSTDV